MADDKKVIGQILYQTQNDRYMMYLFETDTESSKVAHSNSADDTSLDEFIAQCKKKHPQAVILVDQTATGRA